MNFWKVFRWGCAVLFLAVVMFAVLTSGSGGPIESNQPPPAPVFR